MTTAACFFRRAGRYLVSILALAAFMTPSAFAWEYWIGTPVRDDWVDLVDVAIDSSGDVIVSGTQYGDEDAQQRPFLRKLSATGLDVWSHRSFDTAQNVSILPNEAGDIVVLGFNYSPLNYMLDSYKADAYVQKIDGSTGGSIWGDPDEELVDRIHYPADYATGAYIAMLANGDILVTDIYSSPIIGGKISFLRRINGQSGLPVWERQSTGRDKGEIVATPGGTFVSAQFSAPNFVESTILAKFDQETGQLLNTARLAQTFYPKLAVDPNGDLFAVSEFWDEELGRTTEIRKLDGNLTTIWRTVIPQDIERPPNNSSPSFALDGAGNVLLAYRNCQDNTSSDCPETLARISGVDGTVTRGPTLDIDVSSASFTPSGQFIVAGHVAPGVAWIAGFDASTLAGTWERRFGGPEGDAQGAFEKIAVEDDVVVGVGRIFSRRVIDCWNCRLRDALVVRISAVDGSDSQLCGNGILDETEQCDDGNKDEYDACPSRSSDGCRFDKRLARTRAKSPARDADGCKVGWFVADTGLDRDRFGLRRNQVACHDNDPWCDFDPQVGVCGFDVTICLNNDNPLLPACHAEEISSVIVDGVRLRPKQEGGPDLASELSATVNHAVSHLLDPRFPLAGYTASPPLSSEQRGLCSQSFRVSVPLELEGSQYNSRRVQIAMSTMGESTTAKRLRSKLKLACKEALPSR